MQKRVKIESSFFAERFIGATKVPQKNNIMYSIPYKTLHFGDINPNPPDSGA